MAEVAGYRLERTTARMSWTLWLITMTHHYDVVDPMCRRAVGTTAIKDRVSTKCQWGIKYV